VRRLFTSVWRDGTWLEPRLPERPAIRAQSFNERLRAIPNLERHNFVYVSWVLFLFAAYVSRLLIAFYMTGGTLSSTKGIRVELQTNRVSQSAYEQLLDGKPVEGPTGIALDPRSATFVDAQLSPSADPILRETNTPLVPGLLGICDASDERSRVVVALHAAPGVTYQQMVTALDRIDAANRQSEGCQFEAMMVSSL